jgi:hypothetical protein
MNQLSNPDVASVMLILSAMSSLLLGGLVISRNPWRLTHRMFGALTLNLALWSIGVWLIVQSESEPAARFWIMATFAVASFLPATFYHFIVLFPHQRIEGRRWVLGFLYGGAITVSLGTLTPWYIRALEVFPDRPPQVTYGPVFSLFSVLVLVSMVFTFGNLIAKRRISSGIQRRQVENLLVSIYAATGLASITNVVGPMLRITSLELYGPSFHGVADGGPRVCDGALSPAGHLGAGLAHHGVRGSDRVRDHHVPYDGVAGALAGEHGRRGERAALHDAGGAGDCAAAAAACASGCNCSWTGWCCTGATTPRR